MSNDAMMNASHHGLDKEKLQRLIPKGTSHKVTEDLMTLVLNMEKDTGLIQDYLEESLLSHLPVLKEIKVDLPDYVNAIKFCNLKRNMSNEKAWEITFPERYEKLKREGRLNTSHSSMYNSSKVVVAIDTQMLLSANIQYAPLRHLSIMKQYELMNGIAADGMAVSPQVQHLSAKALYELTEPQESSKIELKIGMDDESKSIQTKLMEQISKSVDLQMKRLNAGENISDVQSIGVNLDVIEVEVEENNE